MKKEVQETPADEPTAESEREVIEEEEEQLSDLERAERDRDDYQARLLRAQADYQNLKRRTILDIDAAVTRSQVTLLDDVLLVLDHLDLALAIEPESDEAKNLFVGVRMTRDQLVAALERHDVVPIAAEGAFDPDLHQAVATVETDEHEPGTILEVVRTGWKYRDGVLRHAHVKVAATPDDGEGAEEAP